MMSSGGEIPNPLKVHKSYRKFGFCLFAFLALGIGAIIAFTTWKVVVLVKRHIVDETIRATKPQLPYIYICSNAPGVYNLTGTIYTGCAKKDVSSSALNLTLTPGGGSSRSDGNCEQTKVTVKIKDRLLKLAQPTQCVSFKLEPTDKSDPTDIAWIVQVYLMYPKLGNRNGANGMQHDILGMGMNAYFSDFGGDLLPGNSFYLRDAREVDRKDTLEPFEEGATFLPPFVRTMMQIQRLNRTFTNGRTVVKYRPVGALTSNAVPNVTAALASLHALPPAQVQDYTAVVLSASISFDEVNQQENTLLAIVFTLIGSIPGYISIVFLLWKVFFTIDVPTPSYTISSLMKVLGFREPCEPLEANGNGAFEEKKQGV